MMVAELRLVAGQALCCNCEFGGIVALSNWNLVDCTCTALF